MVAFIANTPIYPKVLICSTAHAAFISGLSAIWSTMHSRQAKNESWVTLARATYLKAQVDCYAPRAGT
jgi:hypothetical protein